MSVPEILFRLFLLLFHGGVLWGVSKTLIRTLPLVESEDHITSRGMSTTYLEFRRTYHRRMRRLSYFGIGLQVWGILMALVGPWTALLGFFALAAPALTVWMGYAPQKIEADRRTKLRKYKLEILLSMRGEGPPPNLLPMTQRALTHDLRDEGLVDSTSPSASHPAAFYLTEDGENYLALVQGVRRLR